MSRGTNEVVIIIVIVVVFRISTRVVVVAVGIIIDVIFELFVIGINDGVIVISGVAFGCRVRSSGEGTVIIRSKIKKKMMVVLSKLLSTLFSELR